MSSQSKEKVSRRFLQSYGGLLTVAEMMEEMEMIKLQVICRYLYQTGVPRIYKKFILKGLDHIFTGVCQSGPEDKIPFIARYNPRTGKYSAFTHWYLKDYDLESNMSV